MSGLGNGSRTAGGAGDDDRSAPRRLSENLDRVVHGLGGGDASPESTKSSKGASGLFSRWAELVGPDIAAHARPQGVQEGRLIVVTDDPAWASQLRWLASELLTRIAEAGGPRLEGLSVRVRPR